MRRRTLLTMLASAPLWPSLARAAELDAELALGANGFATDLFRRVSGEATNAIVGPASISAALAMTYAGARGETEVAMRKVMRFPAGPDATARAWSEWLGRVTGAAADGGYDLRFANRLFGDLSQRVDPAYVELTRRLFGAPLERMDFQGAANASRVRINGWVEEQTNQRIQELLQAKDITSDTKMVLVNAVWFLGEWRTAFAEARTRDGAFTKTDGTTVQVPFMHALMTTTAGRIDGGVIGALPYGKQGRMRMLVAVPESPQGLAGLVAGLSAGQLEKWQAAMRPQKVAVALPRWKATTRFSLAATLRAMGMQVAFSNRADFRGISPSGDLKISDVIHKAFVEVNEKGTEAAAATAVVMVRGSSARPARPPLALRADRPFLYFVQDTSTGTILFMGRVGDPSQHG